MKTQIEIEPTEYDFDDLSDWQLDRLATLPYDMTDLYDDLMVREPGRNPETLAVDLLTREIEDRELMDYLMGRREHHETRMRAALDELETRQDDPNHVMWEDPTWGDTGMRWRDFVSFVDTQQIGNKR